MHCCLLLPETMPVVTASLCASEGMVAHISFLLEVPAMLSPLESSSPMESAEFVRSPGRYRRWQRLSLLRNGQLQQLQSHSARLCRHDHRQSPSHQSLRSNGQTSLSRTDWTLDTLDTSAPPRTTMSANTCLNACVTHRRVYNVHINAALQCLKGGQNRWATQYKGTCPICVRAAISKIQAIACRTRNLFTFHHSSCQH